MRCDQSGSSKSLKSQCTISMSHVRNSRHNRQGQRFDEELALRSTVFEYCFIHNVSESNIKAFISSLDLFLP